MEELDGEDATRKLPFSQGPIIPLFKGKSPPLERWQVGDETGKKEKKHVKRFEIGHNHLKEVTVGLGMDLDGAHGEFEKFYKKIIYIFYFFLLNYLILLS